MVTRVGCGAAVAGIAMIRDVPTLRELWDRLIREDESLLRLYIKWIGAVLALSAALGVVGALEVVSSSSGRYMLQVGAACVAVIGNALPAHQTFSCYQRLRSSRLILELIKPPPEPPPLETVEFAARALDERMAGLVRA